MDGVQERIKRTGGFNRRDDVLFRDGIARCGRFGNNELWHGQVEQMRQQLSQRQRQSKFR